MTRWKRSGGTQWAGRPASAAASLSISLRGGRPGRSGSLHLCPSLATRPLPFKFAALPGAGPRTGVQRAWQARMPAKRAWCGPAGQPPRPAPAQLVRVAQPQHQRLHAQLAQQGALRRRQVGALHLQGWGWFSSKGEHQAKVAFLAWGPKVVLFHGVAYHGGRLKLPQNQAPPHSLPKAVLQARTAHPHTCARGSSAPPAHRCCWSCICGQAEAT